ncbi:hypothetical protein [Schauerella aestuarii]|uniref:hypothetical protein n=1 Tax=Schauerella aestuarii TaxID=2511204 RepID=UPI00136A567E|nr:hypothetical protein [Achromobacter aestuarii]MYZ41377.1 hypothetical protein [Achromobacter aestuarii]
MSDIKLPPLPRFPRHVIYDGHGSGEPLYSSMQCDARCTAAVVADRAAREEVVSEDSKRLDWIERRINQHGAIHLHDGKHPYGIGLGLRPGNLVRDLRQAIDTARGFGAPTQERGADDDGG